MLRTEPCTVAYDVELQRGDIIVRLCARELRRCADIPAALKEFAERGASEPLVLQYFDAGGRLRTVRWSPAEAAR